MGYVLDKQGNYEDAIDAFSHAIELAPDNEKYVASKTAVEATWREFQKVFENPVTLSSQLQIRDSSETSPPLSFKAQNTQSSSNRETPTPGSSLLSTNEPSASYNTSGTTTPQPQQQQQQADFNPFLDFETTSQPNGGSNQATNVHHPTTTTTTTTAAAPSPSVHHPISRPHSPHLMPNDTLPTTAARDSISMLHSSHGDSMPITLQQMSPIGGRASMDESSLIHYAYIPSSLALASSNAATITPAIASTAAVVTSGIINGSSTTASSGVGIGVGGVVVVGVGQQQVSASTISSHPLRHSSANSSSSPNLSHSSHHHHQNNIHNHHSTNSHHNLNLHHHQQPSQSQHVPSQKSDRHKSSDRPSSGRGTSNITTPIPTATSASSTSGGDESSSSSTGSSTGGGGGGSGDNHSSFASSFVVGSSPASIVHSRSMSAASATTRPSRNSIHGSLQLHQQQQQQADKSASTTMDSEKLPSLSQNDATLLLNTLQSSLATISSQASSLLSTPSLVTGGGGGGSSSSSGPVAKLSSPDGSDGEHDLIHVGPRAKTYLEAIYIHLQNVKTVADAEKLENALEEILAAVRVKRAFLASKAASSSDSDDKCACCWERPPEMVCIPCGHLCICEECKSKLRQKKCPICSQPVKNIYRVFK
jgi:hypothetical protein